MTSARRRRAFQLRFRLARGIQPTQAEQVTRSLVESADLRGLLVAGSLREESLLVIARAAGDAEADDRRALARWAISRPELADYWVGPLVDLDEIFLSQGPAGHGPPTGGASLQL